MGEGHGRSTHKEGKARQQAENGTSLSGTPAYIWGCPAPACADLWKILETRMLRNDSSHETLYHMHGRKAVAGSCENQQDETSLEMIQLKEGGVQTHLVTWRERAGLRSRQAMITSLKWALINVLGRTSGNVFS